MPSQLYSVSVLTALAHHLLDVPADPHDSTLATAYTTQLGVVGDLRQDVARYATATDRTRLARALVLAGTLASQRGDHEPALSHLDEAVAMFDADARGNAALLADLRRIAAWLRAGQTERAQDALATWETQLSDVQRTAYAPEIAQLAAARAALDGDAVASQFYLQQARDQLGARRPTPGLHAACAVLDHWLARLSEAASR